jgi:hypothetical protein
MSATLTLEGVKALEAQLRNLPYDLTQAAQARATAWAYRAVGAIGAGYAATSVHPTGSRAAGLQVIQRSRGPARAVSTVVQNTQPLANYLEYGTKGKARYTGSTGKRGRGRKKTGHARAHRGVLAERPVFRRTMVALRPLFLQDVLQVLLAQGLKVTHA